MTRILLINPSKWGRGITPIWIPSHASLLKEGKHEVSLFDSTFYKDWSECELKFNTSNSQYKPSAIDKYIKWNTLDILEELQNYILKFNPEIIFWSAISSHIHGEGEYINFLNGYELINKVEHNAILVTSGLIPTADPIRTSKEFNKCDYIIAGESEEFLRKIADNIHNWPKKNGCPEIIKQSEPIKLSEIPPYEYSLFDDQIFYRPYNGDVVKAVDIELSRGCPFSCGYCVETVIQRNYGFTEKNSSGIIKNSNSYLRSKSFENLISELENLYYDFGIRFFRFQDTNFLTADRKLLKNLSNSDLFKKNKDIKLYIETRPETINKSSVELLEKLNVDGVGMGIEISSDSFKNNHLDRFCDTQAIKLAFKLLKEKNIKRTSYNVIGFPNQTEDDIKSTINFNAELNPDNITVAFYSPYIGTDVGDQGFNQKQFKYLKGYVDGQLSTAQLENNSEDFLPNELLYYYKKNFTSLVRGK